MVAEMPSAAEVEKIFADFMQYKLWSPKVYKTQSETNVTESNSFLILTLKSSTMKQKLKVQIGYHSDFLPKSSIKLKKHMKR